ncbi:MAG: Zn(2+)-responsive transcriptional regulator [Pseudomonadales bacterium]|jgi:MerR family Zn(II)-responsive transcriptional regulator of zntA|nr:Zn(2+)-responsive transcriptional regulator [Pseudomonadales bacterium]
MRIGELAKQSGLTVDTLRYYEKEGVIPAPARSESGYREYLPETVDFLRFVQSAKAVGFSLKECRNLLEIFHHRSAHTCAEVKSLSEIKLEELDQQMKNLKAMHQTLKAISDACCGSTESAASCAILNHLEEASMP